MSTGLPADSGSKLVICKKLCKAPIGRREKYSARPIFLVDIVSDLAYYQGVDTTNSQREGDGPMDDTTITYDVFSECTGNLYYGTDESAADAAWDRMVSYIDNDTSGEAIHLRYLVNGVLFNAYRSINSV